MPITRSPRNTGVATVRSLIWPAVIHGSLVSSTSPGASDSGGKAATMCRAPVAIALMWPGVPLWDWPSIRPARSKTPHARSSDSRTIVENAVRTSVACCSSRIEASRPAAIPTVTGSRRHAVTSDDEAAVLGHAGGRARPDDGGGLALLDDRRAVDPRARTHPVAVVDRGGDVGVVEPHVARALLRLAVAGGRGDEAQVGVRAAGQHPPADGLDRHVRTLAAVRAHVRRLERGLEVLARLDRNRDLEALADVAHVDRALVRDLGRAGRGQDRGALLLELGEQRLHARERVVVDRLDAAAHTVGRERRGEHADAAHHARRRGHDHGRGAERGADAERVHRPGAAEREQAAGRWRRGRARRRARARRWPCPR